VPSNPFYPTSYFYHLIPLLLLFLVLPTVFVDDSEVLEGI
jgi:hypothetical protein